MNKNKLGNDVHELYRYFIVRMNEIVKIQQADVSMGRI